MTSSLSQLFLETVLPLMKLALNDRIIDLGCGDGWASRALASAIPDGLVIGLDASNDLVREARAKSVGFENIIYIWGNAEQIPWQADFFTAVICVDSLTAFADPAQSLRELHRVLAAGGSVWILASNAGSLPDHTRLLTDAGFERIESSVQSFRTAAADEPSTVLLFTARKPGEASADTLGENSNGIS